MDNRARVHLRNNMTAQKQYSISRREPFKPDRTKKCFVVRTSIKDGRSAQ